MGNFLSLYLKSPNVWTTDLNNWLTLIDPQKRFFCCCSFLLFEHVLSSLHFLYEQKFFHINVLFPSLNLSSPDADPPLIDSSFPFLSARAAAVKVQKGATAHFSGNGGHDACLVCINLNQYSLSWKHKHLKGSKYELQLPVRIKH